jgi:glycerophosphoryl diester phosphodiesterase
MISGNFHLMILRFLFPITLSLASFFAKAESPLVIAHRGASGYVPEHTLEAKAMAHAMGADFLEQDLVLSRDDVPVVLHDTQIDTVTDVATQFPDRKREDGRYYALDFTLAELKQLRVTERFDSQTGKPVYPTRFPGGKGRFEIVSLEEELEFIGALNQSTGRNVGIYPEIKKPKWHRDQGHDISPIVLSILEKFGYRSKEDACFLQCFEIAEVKRIREELGWKGRLVMLLSGGGKGSDGTDFPHLRTRAGLQEISAIVDGIGPSIGSILSGKSPEDRQITDLVKHAHAANLVVHPYTMRADDLQKTVSSVDDLMDLLFHEVGVDGLFTDFPDITVKWIEEQG